MVVDERERAEAILDAAAELVLRLGYNKLTMGDVADAVALHRGLVYLQFKSKDELIEAVVRRELDRYAELWTEQLQADPRGGSVASIYRAMARALQRLPLAAAIVARDEAILGKYLHKPGTYLTRIKHVGTEQFLQTMQEAGAVRPEIDARAVAFILDALTPALRRTFPTQRDRSDEADLPTTEAVVDALAELLELGLSPVDGADLAAGKALLLAGLAEVRAAFSA
ncbi:TetR/AcrR family transcriptional regulator [Nocardia transvalensis]|uniref:TetR/AcrR family transcriptional regulator n=1 Tax=Nocardia transvalensis TaxID=37333 RepID=UPI001895CCB0|nr:TetR/AcrR family transcriptional regulator [Nocardia transvalensis]MBF6328130.1 TetR/AcrR family transcriptional regulator [Nocardia transvalensis]